MLSDDDLLALNQARHPDPFAVLGLHADTGGRWWVRSLLPGARSVAAVDPARPQVRIELQACDGGALWQAALPQRTDHFDFRLAVRWAGDAADAVGSTLVDS